MKRLVFADGIYGSLCALACQFRGEFAVTLFGDVRGEDYCVSHIAPPGKNAESDFARCTNDAEFEADVFHQLRRKNPEIRKTRDHSGSIRLPGVIDIKMTFDSVLGREDHAQKALFPAKKHTVADVKKGVRQDKSVLNDSYHPALFHHKQPSALVVRMGYRYGSRQSCGKWNEFDLGPLRSSEPGQKNDPERQQYNDLKRSNPGVHIHSLLPPHLSGYHS